MAPAEIADYFVIILESKEKTICSKQRGFGVVINSTNPIQLPLLTFAN